MIQIKIIKLNILYFNNILSLIVISITTLMIFGIETSVICFATQATIFRIQDFFFKTFKNAGTLNFTRDHVQINLDTGKKDVYKFDKSLKIILEYTNYEGYESNISVFCNRVFSPFATIFDLEGGGADGIGTIYVEQNGEELKYKILFEKDCDEELIRLKSDIEANGGNIVILRNYIDIFKSRLKLKF
jgi:hypothetical protein